MGTFVYLEGEPKIPDNKKDEFNRNMIKLMHAGCVGTYDTVTLFDKEINLWSPVKKDKEDGVYYFDSNYFEDDVWESCGYDPKNQNLWSNKSGYDSLSETLQGMYLLYELYSDNCVALINNRCVSASYVNWINYVLNTNYPVGFRFCSGDVANRLDALSKDFNLKNNHIILDSFMDISESLDYYKIYSLQTQYFFTYRHSAKYDFNVNDDEGYFAYPVKDDFVYWLDDPEEFSEETQKWFKKLRAKYREFLNQNDEQVGLRKYVNLLDQINKRYYRIFVFEHQFEEFIDSFYRPEVQAAIKLLKWIADDPENVKEGSIVENMKYPWGLENSELKFNAGRKRIRRYLALLANKTLREKLFNF